MDKKIILIVLTLIISINLFIGCIDDNIKTREEAIPNDAVKMTPEIDLFPPKLHSNEYNKPIPMIGPINTEGAEDSPFIPCCDEDTFYFFFTPDVEVPPEKQLLDGITGIYVSKKVDGEWNNPKRVILQNKWKLSLDGCTFVQDDIMWFCSARQGYTGIHWFTAENKDGKWKNWQNADFDPELDVGELHFTNNFTELYYHSSRQGGKGGTDIWYTQKVNDTFQEPINIEIVNSEDNEGYPYVTPDGNELWFNKWYLGTPAVFRSIKVDGEWQEPELIISQFAGEPTLDNDGNIYFVHHFYEDGVMIEADIYVAYKI
jgi:hypothetical protein